LAAASLRDILRTHITQETAMRVLKIVAFSLASAVVSFSTVPRGAAAASFARLSADVPQTIGQQTPLPPGVERAGQNGVTNPRVLRRVGPRYTAEAMAAKIEGTVIVECVVHPNGTVDAVRVVKSLDPVYGLDDEAVRAAKQWRFEPGKRDGGAVPVLISIELTFRLTNREGAVPFLAPSLFDAIPSAKSFRENVMYVVDPPPPDWPVLERNAPGINVRFLYPQGWRVSDDTSPSGWLVIQSEDGTRLMLVSQLHPASWPQSTGGGATRSELQQLRDTLQRRLSAMRSHARVHANGWMPLLRIWAWHETWVPAGDPSMPTAIAADTRGRFDGARWWRFIRNVGSQEIALDCYVMRRRGVSKAEADEDVREAGPQFLTMLRRMLIETR
jgi:TonB family protein